MTCGYVGVEPITSSGDCSEVYDEGILPRSPMFLDLKIPIVIDIGFGSKEKKIPFGSHCLKAYEGENLMPKTPFTCISCTKRQTQKG
jgi:hypothetical protein